MTTNAEMAEFRHNRQVLIVYHLLTSAALSMAGGMIFLDVLLLRTGVDPARFGVIKSSIYFLPAVSYLILAPLLQRLDRAVGVTVTAYLIRVTLPLGLPLLALCGVTETGLIAGFMAILGVSYSCAMIANNTLLTLFRRSFPEAAYNRTATLVTGLFAIPAVLLALPLAGLLDLAAGWSDSAFLTFYLILQFLTALPELPAALALRKLRPAPARRAARFRFSDYLAPYRNPDYRRLMAAAFLNSMWVGLLSVYLTVYLLTVRRWPLALVSATELLLTCGLAAGSFLAGLAADRRGYRPVFIALAAILAAVSLSFALWPAAVLTLVFILLVYNGNLGMLSGALRSLLQAAAGNLCNQDRPQIAIAAYTLWVSLGGFTGTLAGGALYQLLAGLRATPEALYDDYFLIVTVPLGMMLAVLSLRRKNSVFSA